MPGPERAYSFFASIVIRKSEFPDTWICYFVKHQTHIRSVEENMKEGI